jgi:hypothetical protein
VPNPLHCGFIEAMVFSISEPPSIPVQGLAFETWDVWGRVMPALRDGWAVGDNVTLAFSW